MFKYLLLILVSAMVHALYAREIHCDATWLAQKTDFFKYFYSISYTNNFSIQYAVINRKSEKSFRAEFDPLRLPDYLEKGQIYESIVAISKHFPTLCKQHISQNNPSVGGLYLIVRNNGSGKIFAWSHFGLDEPRSQLWWQLSQEVQGTVELWRKESAQLSKGPGDLHLIYQSLTIKKVQDKLFEISDINYPTENKDFCEQLLKYGTSLCHNQARFSLEILENNSIKISKYIDQKRIYFAIIKKDGTVVSVEPKNMRRQILLELDSYVLAFAGSPLSEILDKIVNKATFN